MDISEVPTIISQNQTDIANMKLGIQELETNITNLETISAQLGSALDELNSSASQGIGQIQAKQQELLSAKNALNSAKNELASTKTQLENAQEELSEQKDKAVDAASIEVTMDMVNQILSAQNFSMPVGYITEDNVDYLIRVGEKVDSIDEVKNITLFDTGIESVGTVKLSDVADVFLLNNSNELYSKTNGTDNLMLSFSKQSSYATKTVSDNVNAKFRELEEKYDGLVFRNLNDQGDSIDLIVENVLSNMIWGGILAVIILILFLKDLKPTIIIACSIPISILLAIVLMYFSGITLNIISLSGLAIGVGMLVDNSVVVIENIHRMRTQGVPALKAAVQGAVQVAGAITASTLTTVCVFLPIVFIEGITRQLFQDMALTVGYSLLASLIIALTLVPAMASGMLKEQKEKRTIFMDKLINGYGKISGFSLNHKWIVILLSIALLVGSVMIAFSKGFIFMPSMSGMQLSITANAPEGSTFEEKTALADEIYEAIKDVDGIETFGVSVPNGEESAGLIMSMGTGSSDITIYAIMEKDTKRKDSEISKEILEKTKDIKADIVASGAMDMSSMLTAMGGEGVSVKVFGQNLDNLIKEADLLAEKLEKIDGVSSVSTGLEDAKPEFRIIVDTEKAAKHSLTVAQVYQAVSGKISTEKSFGDISVNSNSTEMILYSEENLEMKTAELEKIMIDYQDKQGEKQEVKLTDIAEIIETKSLSTISRENQRRTLSVSAKISEDANITLVANEIDAVLQDYETLAGNTLEITGENETIMEAIIQLALMLAMAIVIIYFIMVAQFQSFKLPFIVMFTIPLAFTGGFIALLMTGHTLSVVSMIGFVMLSGIIVNNGIVLIDYINVLRLEGVEKREAIILAGKTRMRPILMTALTTVLGLLFMALGTGIGSEMMQPIAIVCIGGLIYATLMTLFVIPAMYDILSKKNVVRRDVD